MATAVIPPVPGRIPSSPDDLRCAVQRLGLVSIFLILAVSPMLGQSNPIPLINQPLVPASAAPGGSAFTLTINGTGFTSTAAVYWNGSIRPTAVVSGSQVQAQISATDIAKPGFGWVTVGNLGTREVQSNVIYFPVRSSAKGVGFLPRSIQHVVYSSGPIAVGDFNNDGLLDFAVGGGTTGGIQVFLGKGNGTFQLPTTISTPTVYSIVAGDFNGDGNLDLAVTNACTGCGEGNTVLRVFLGNGKGAFPSIKRISLVSNSIFPAAADFNGDGKLDLYRLGEDFYDGPYFDIWLGNGDGTFARGSGGSFLPYGSDYPAIADFNGDGKLDVAVAGSDSNGGEGVDVFLGDGKGGFSSPVFYPVEFAGDSAAAADVNGDGKVDLITNGVSVLLGNGDGTFRTGASVMSGGIGSANIGDFNGDGKLDVLAGLSLLLGNGDGTFQQPLTFAGMKAQASPISMSAFNANGNLDLLGINGLGSVLSIFEQRPLYFTPINLDFGTVQVGTTSPPQTAGLTNFGASKLIIQSVNITGANAADFAQTNNCGSGLPSNKSCQAQVTFTPSFVGYEYASLNVTYQGSAPFSMALSGAGTNQTFTVTLTPASLTFAAQLLGTTSPPQPATLTNTGNQPVTISNIAATAPFSQTNNCPATLPVSSNCTIQVTFTPTDKGTANGTLSVTDDATGSPQKVQLSGTGTTVVISPIAINFGNQKVGTKSAQIPVTLSNLGTSSLSITQIAIKGTDPNDFTQTNNCGSSVPPQSKCTIKVTFTPKAKGSRSANLSITDNDPTSPQSIPLSGDGT